MSILRIKNLSGYLSPAKFEVLQASEVIYFVDELSSFARGLLSFTRFRMVFPLVLKMQAFKSGELFILERKKSFPSVYTLTSYKNNMTVALFKPAKRLFISTLWDIKEGEGSSLGKLISKNPFVLGPQTGEIRDNYDNIIAKFKWGKFSLWKGYSECKLFMNKDDRRWLLISITGAIIKALYLHQR